MNVVTENQSYFEFKRTEEVEEWARKYYADLLDSPREDESRKLISGYTGNCYKYYNKLLRYYMPVESHTFRQIDSADTRRDVMEIEKIIEVLCKYSLPENIIAYRFTRKEDIISLCSGKRIRIGTEFSDKAFFSKVI